MTSCKWKLRIFPLMSSLILLEIVRLIMPGHSVLGADERIVFHSDRVGNHEIHAVDADGANLARLTINPAYDINPACSPDGRKIAFASNRTGNFEIFVMNADGTNPLRLTDHPERDDSPCWSPDASKIVFVSSRDGNYEIYVMDADGNNPVRLTEHGRDDDSPSWSPDGRKIAFESNRDGGFASKDIFVMDANGENPVNLTINPGALSNSDPCWAPDSSKIAFQSWRDDHRHFEIYTMNTNGKQILRLTEGNGANIGPSWSPDSNKIAYGSNRAGDWSIYVMDSDGQNPVRLTKPPPDAWDSSACWLSGGTFAVAPREKWHIFWGAIKQTVTLFDSYESKTNNEPRTKE